jgi:hypothetical protein
LPLLLLPLLLLLTLLLRARPLASLRRLGATRQQENIREETQLSSTGQEQGEKKMGKDRESKDKA